MIGVVEVEKYRNSQIKMEMDGATFELLQTLLAYWSAELLVTRASVGEKIVAVVKKREEGK